MAESYTQSDIESLITCRKYIISPPKKEAPLIGAYFRNSMKLISEEWVRCTFEVFMRRSEDFPENFSIGLACKPEGKPEINVLRCNGKHGHNNGSTPLHTEDHSHWHFHIHRASAEALENGQRAEKIATATTEYSSYDEAVEYFIGVINLDAADRAKHFPKAPIKLQRELGFDQLDKIE